MPSTRQHSVSPRKLPHSSDTELFETPVRKRYRSINEDESPSSSPSAWRSPRKRQRVDMPKKQAKEMELEKILRRIVAQPNNHDAIVALKSLPRDETSPRLLVKHLMRSAKAAVMKRKGSKKVRLLETELYMDWLNELNYVHSALFTCLNTKVPNTRKRLPGLGRVSYTILYNLVDEFIDEVNTHHDRPCSLNSPEPCLYPATMTLVEEAKDPSTDERSEEAVELAEHALKAIDKVLADAVRRYKAECGRNNPSLAQRISAQQHALAKGCCLLCEQTGYGTDESDMGDTLMEETREVMEHWKNEYEDCEDQLVDSD
ncbi:hypothetical protein CVT25_003120 [Psilocybe cyanescens]|uniref:Uncharacterized protein n=1 Tax=Psilocybe cyanescens TaxID=93625 RepID=A0A409XQU1_PSICY|nr:hypothetical protein CVT25_003120 [Psilocybe cyanescens]